MSLFKLFRSKPKAKVPEPFASPSTSTSSPPPYSAADLGGKPTFEVAGLEKLGEYDTIFLVDDSSSMSTDAPSGKTRWKEVRRFSCCVQLFNKPTKLLQACTALADFADIAAKHDDDGIDIHFINKSASGCGLKVGLDHRSYAAPALAVPLLTRCQGHRGSQQAIRVYPVGPHRYWGEIEGITTTRL
jgi:hypothetical protein